MTTCLKQKRTRSKRQGNEGARQKKWKGKRAGTDTPHIARLLQAGFTMEQFLRKRRPTFWPVSGKSRYFENRQPNNPTIADPDHVPMAALFAMYMKKTPRPSLRRSQSQQSISRAT